MYPDERSLVERNQHKPFVLIGINSDKDREALKKVLQEQRITWRSFMDGGTGGPIARRWGIHAWPSIFVLDQKGIIRARDVRGADLDAAVALLLRRTPTEEVRMPSRPAAEEHRVATGGASPGNARAQASGGNEQLAGQKLRLARLLADAGKVDKARMRVEEVIKEFPGTSAAKEAEEYLRELNK
jgi:hypothetical protein